MPRIPSLRHHKPSGRAVVTIAGKDHYVGRYGSPESIAEYDRLISEWLAAGRPANLSHDPTVGEVLVKYLEFCADYYVSPSTECNAITQALRPLKAYANIPITKLGPLVLRAMMDTWATEGLARTTINKRKGKVVRFARWAVSRELAPPSLREGLASVEPLRVGRSNAKETSPRTPVSDELVDATLPHLSPAVATIIQVMRLTGCRGKEACDMRTGDINTEERPDLWAYRPRSHKNSHRGQPRTIWIGPSLQEILKPWLKDDPDAYIFQPKESIQRLKRLQQAAHRKEADRQRARLRKRKPNVSSHRFPGSCYESRRISKAVRRACLKNDIPCWTPYQLRHALGTRVERDYGFDASRRMLGKRSGADTARYIHADESESARIAMEIG